MFRIDKFKNQFCYKEIILILKFVSFSFIILELPSLKNEWYVQLLSEVFLTPLKNKLLERGDSWVNVLKVWWNTVEEDL